jgi:signal transduction histidine kinase
MGNKRGIFFLSVLAGVAVVIITAYGFVNLQHRPGIRGFRSHPIMPKDPELPAIQSLEGVRIETPRDVEFLLSRKSVGDEVTYERRTSAGVETVRARLMPYYEVALPIFLAIGVLGFLIGFLVYFLKWQDPQARIFYWATIAFSSAVIISGDLYGVRGGGLSLLPGVLLDFAYPLAPALLWRFTRTFSVGREKTWFRFFWAVPLLFGCILSIGYLYSQLKPSLEVFRISVRYLSIFRFYVAFACLAAIFEMVRAFRKSESEEVRAQIKWIFFGLVVGLVPFIFLYQLPQILGGAGSELMTEDMSSVFLIFIPACIALAILRHRLMNINLVINRSLVYSLLTIFMVGAYLLIVELLRTVFVRTALVGGNAVSIGAAVLVAAVFQPARHRIQKAVDKTFFRQRYDYQKAVMNFNARAQKIMDPDHLVSQFAGAIGEVLPLEKLGAAVCEPTGDGPKFTLLKGMEEKAAWAFLSLAGKPDVAWARPETVGTAEAVDLSAQGLLGSLGWEAVMLLPFGSGALAGCVALGPKKSGQRFTREDLDLVETLAGELALGLQRVRLQEEIFYERASREKSDELSRLKTEFISSVSHELRTPMASLQSLSELLGSGKVQDEAKRERLLHLMAGECGRLSRFVHNVLDFAKIEKDTKLYDLRTADLQPLVREVVDLCRLGTAAEGFKIGAEMPDGPVPLEADHDAVRQALLNLMDNAIKYSESRKEITVRLVPGSENVEIQVQDQGIGIGPEDRERIFDAFFRAPSAARRNPKGVGLGLMIVKHIMDAHGGRIGLKSELGTGTTFSLIFPLRRST